MFILPCFFILHLFFIRASVSLKTRAFLWDSEGESWKVKVSDDTSCWYLAQLFEEAHKNEETVEGQGEE